MSWIESFLEPANLLSLAAGVGCFATVLTLARPVFAGDKLAGRLKQVALKREELRRKSRTSLEAQKPAQGLRQQSKGLVHQIVETLDLRKRLEDPTLTNKLMQAGLRGPMPVNIFYFCRAALPIAFAIAAFAYVKLFGHQFEDKLLMIVGGATGLGFYLPNIYLSNLIQKRRDSIMRAFPDALDMLLICVESGMSMELALQRVASEIGAASVELAEELSLTTAELAYLQDRRLAYENLAKRTNHPGVKSVAMALTQAERYGTPLGSALRVMAKENREMRLAAAEKKAAALPAQLTVPMIVFFLPVLFVVILGPGGIRVMETFQK